MPREDAEKIKQLLKALGPLRLHDVERAQQRVVALIREMEEAGEIVVARPGQGPTMVE